MTLVKDILFEPVSVGSLRLSNRIYMPAMHLGMAEDFEVTSKIIDFYSERARGGAGLICVGFATVDEMSGMPSCIGAHKDSHIGGLRRLSTAIKEEGARAAVQLNHMGRYNMSFFLGGKQPVAPSAVSSWMTRETPRELNQAEIGQIVRSFAAAAGRVKAAGFDAVEILCGTGYLISSFLSPLTNRRTDEYGGSFENRARFALEVVRAVRESVGPNFPVIARTNGNDFMPEGIGRMQLIEFAKVLSGAGVDALCVNVGWHESPVPQVTAAVPRAAYAYLARGVKEAVSVPVIACHRINDPETARQIISDGLCDMVSMGRALIADPFLPQKARMGREDEVVHCIACGQGCFDNLFKLKHIECLCNPRAGHEGERCVERAPRPLQVLVAGGGLAGMSAAAAAAERGHRVTLCEKSSRLGGQALLAGAAPGREEFLSFVRDLEVQLAKRGVRVLLGCEVNEALIKEHKPEVVIVATGAMPASAAIEGTDLPHVAEAWDVLAGKVPTGRRVVIIGGGAVGVQTALLLARKGTLSAEAIRFLLVNEAERPELLRELAVRGTKEIVLIEMRQKIGEEIGRTSRWVLLRELARAGVVERPAMRAVRITAEGVEVESGQSRTLIPADTVVLAVGAVPRNPLQPVLERAGIPFHVVGDAASVADAFNAVHQGFAVGRTI